LGRANDPRPGSTKGVEGLFRQPTHVVRSNMVLHLVRVLALLVAACLAPSLAYAHAGHAHSHASAPQDMPAAAGHHDQGRMVAAVVVKAATVSTARSAGDPEPAGCAGHCCGAVTGMPCCSAVLVPEIIAAPDITTSRLVRFARADALQGLPPKALPKPPKLLG
jgi:hypothetical protein